MKNIVFLFLHCNRRRENIFFRHPFVNCKQRTIDDEQNDERESENYEIIEN